jgi:hypothetical protein
MIILNPQLICTFERQGTLLFVLLLDPEINVVLQLQI